MILGQEDADYAVKLFAVLGAAYFNRHRITDDTLLQLALGNLVITLFKVSQDEEIKNLRLVNRILAGRVFDFSRELAAKSTVARVLEHDEELARMNKMLMDKEEQLVQTEKLAVMGTLVAGLAHEIKNPLTAVNGFLSVLRKQLIAQDNYRINTALEGMKLGIDHLNELVNNFVEFSRRSTSEFIEVDILELVYKAISIAAVKLKDNGITAEIRLTTELPKLKAIPGQLVQVFLNLIMNAIHAMEPGGLIVVESPTQPRDKYLELRFTDNGHGISPENLARIFDAFFTTKDATSGAGLGLSITYGIVEKHKGFIDVKSDVGKGTTFIIKLPTVYYES